MRRPPPEVHLKQAVLRLHESLREEQIAVVLRVDVRHAPAVADDAHRRREAGHRHRPRDLRDERRQRRLGATAAGHDASGTEHTEQNQPRGQQTAKNLWFLRRVAAAVWRMFRCAHVPPRRCYTGTMAIKDALLTDYDHEMGTTRRLLARVPDDRLAWKPHEKSMSLGGLATHVSRIASWGGTILNDPFFDVAEAPPPGAERRHAPRSWRPSTTRARGRAPGWTRSTANTTRSGP